MKKIKKIGVKILGSVGAFIGSNAVIFNVVGVINYTELKIAVIVAGMLLVTAYAIDKSISK
jgi:hypothetical protein